MDSSESGSLFHTNTHAEAVKRKKDEYEYPIADKTQVAVENTIKQFTMAKVRCCLFILKYKICQFCKRLKVNIKRTKTFYGHFRDFKYQNWTYGIKSKQGRRIQCRRVLNRLQRFGSYRLNVYASLKYVPVRNYFLFNSLYLEKTKDF